jgi:hypothetical protein
MRRAIPPRVGHGQAHGAAQGQGHASVADWPSRATPVFRQPQPDQRDNPGHLVLTRFEHK